MTEDNKVLVQISVIFDIVLTGFAYLIAEECKIWFLPANYRGLIQTLNYDMIILLVFIIWFVSLQYSNLHIFYFRKTPFSTLLFKVTQLVTINLLIVAFFFYIFKIQDVSRLMIGIFYIVNIVLLTLSRWLFRKILNVLRKKRGSSHSMLVVVGS
jgi:FlaA1/EpsC-like NDP-sugar epimerase